MQTSPTLAETRRAPIPLIAATAAAAGVASALAWAPWSFSGLPPLAFGLFHLALMRSASPLEAGFSALLFGLAQHIAGHGWVFHALSAETDLSLPMAVLATSCFMLYLASFQAIPVYLWARFLRCRHDPHSLAGPALLAALLTLGEWLRSMLFNGTSSLSIGYTLLDTPLAGLLPIIGLYGLGFLAYFLCLGWPLAIRALPARRCRPALALLLLLIAGLSLGHLGSGMPWVEPAGGPLDFRLIQTSTPQQEKFMPERVPLEITRLAERLMAAPASLIVAPETAFPVFFHQLPSGLLDRLTRFARDNGSHFFIGVAQMGLHQQGHNSVLHLSAEPQPEFFGKERLMPFGEYSPAGFDWLSQRLHLALQDLSPSPPGQRPFIAAGRTLAPLICHEDSSSQLARLRAAHASILLNPSNLAWFAGSTAIPQGLAMARARALETGRPVLRATNSGGAVHIDHHGRIAGSLPAGQAGELSGHVQPTQGATPYARLGDLPILIFCLALPLIVIGRRKPAHHFLKEGHPHV